MEAAGRVAARAKCGAVNSGRTARSGLLFVCDALTHMWKGDVERACTVSVSEVCRLTVMWPDELSGTDQTECCGRRE